MLEATGHEIYLSGLRVNQACGIWLAIGLVIGSYGRRTRSVSAAPLLLGASETLIAIALERAGPCRAVRAADEARRTDLQLVDLSGST